MEMNIKKLTGRLKAELSHLRDLPLLSLKGPTLEEKAGHKKAQDLAYQCALTISREIRPGWTEKQTAKLMDTFLRDHGVKVFFHQSFAWFGDRTCFKGFSNYFHFMPSSRELKEEEVVILDTAPYVNGYVGDIGYTFCLKPHTELEKAKEDLLYFRQRIPELFKSPMKAQEICQKVEDELHDKGYENCHAKYPFSVLGHRVHKARGMDLPGLTYGFSVHAYLSLLSKGLLPELFGPHHKGSKLGLWAIEPHLGKSDFGAKFEEILVVEKERVYWLTDEVPHLQWGKGAKHAK